LETCDTTFFENIVLHLLGLSTKEIMEERNSYGERPDILLKEVMSMLNNKQNTYLLDSDGESEAEEREWNAKLFDEMTSEDPISKYESYAQDELEDTFKKTKAENFAEWGDRIRTEYHTSKNPPPRKSSTQNERETTSEETRCGPTLVHELKKKLEVMALREKYENLCKETFSSNASKTLRFGDVPWPVHCEYKTVTEDLEHLLNDILEVFSLGLEGEDRIKYLKKQQVRWHPDRFLQKCDQRLHSEDKEHVMEMVNHLSQRLNATLDELSS